MKFEIHILNIALSKQDELYSMCKYYMPTHTILYTIVDVLIACVSNTYSLVSAKPLLSVPDI